MGWVVPELIRRDWSDQSYRADEWRRFCHDHQLYVIYAAMRDTTAFLIGNYLILPDGLDPFKTSWLAWHELGHFVVHVGNREAWRRTILGEHTIQKFEHQALEFAILFPDWRCYLDEGVGV